MQYKEIKNIIFDLGGVILDIEPQKAVDEFSRIGVKNLGETYHALEQHQVFEKFETGAITRKEFFDQLRGLAGSQLIDKEIKDAWNSMIIDLRAEKIEMLEQLAKKFRLFLLSNTNEIHLEHYSALLHDKFGLPHFGHIFEKAYYSHLMDCRKPDVQIFKQILDENSLGAKESLFIDDSETNTRAAEKVGLKSFHVKDDEGLRTLVKNLLKPV